MKFFLFGAPLVDNLGGPSIFYGMDYILSKICPDSNAVYIEEGNGSDRRCVVNKIITDVKVMNIDKKTILIHALLYKYLRLKLFKRQSILQNLLDADIIMNVWGIQFSDKLNNNINQPFSKKSFIGGNLFEYIGRLFKKKIVSYTKSFGPVVSAKTKKEIQLYAQSYCDLFFCREQQSKLELENCSISAKMVIAPDSGLLMPMEKFDASLYLRKDKSACVSVSWQIIKQWSSEEKYVNIVKELIIYLLKQDYHIILLPNELHENEYDDWVVAQEIKENFQNNDNVTVFPFNQYSALQVKYLISKCDVMIASRYHSVIAALSSNVPTLVIGWHYKYEELLSYYNQKDYLLNSDSCTAKTLICKAEQLISDSDKVRKSLAEVNINMRKHIVEKAHHLTALFK